MMDDAEFKKYIEIVKQRIAYNPETGDLTYKRDFRNVKVGDIVGFIHTHPKTNAKYRRVYFAGKKIGAHILIWMLFYGEQPKEHIDHINGDGTDNRIENLRCCGYAGNSKNRRLISNNKSGHMGVYKSKYGYTVTISANRVRYHIGTFKDLTSAAAARKKAELELGFHANHGRIQNEAII